MKEQPMNPDRCRELLGQLLDGNLSHSEKAELNELLKSDAGARRMYRQQARLHAALDWAYAGGGNLAAAMLPVRESQRNRSAEEPVVRHFARSAWKLAAALVALLGVAWFFQAPNQAAVATLVSSENAAWESVLPTALNSRLAPGSLELKYGMATVRFDSGATVTLEAPARLEIIHAMRGRLVGGAAIIEAPNTAKGFVMEAPNCYVVDHGTRFAMSASSSGDESKFEVLSGEIAVHHPSSKKEDRLYQGQGATMTVRGLERVESPFSREDARTTQPALRIGTGGKTQSIVRSGTQTALNPAFLLLKSTVEPDHPTERRSFLSFDLSGVHVDSYAAVRLVFNLVPSGHGLAVRVPPEIRFQVYGLPEPVPFEWGSPWKWEAAPTPADGQLLGSFSVPRSQQKGNVGLSGDALLNFLKKHRGESVCFLIVRETKAQASGSLVHAFASDSHREAPGPALEFF
jgi:ferric-dicitrate binding protein FerR (iron transport regulator)